MLEDPVILRLRSVLSDRMEGFDYSYFVVDCGVVRMRMKCWYADVYRDVERKGLWLCLYADSLNVDKCSESYCVL